MIIWMFISSEKFIKNIFAHLIVKKQIEEKDNNNQFVWILIEIVIIKF